MEQLLNKASQGSYIDNQLRLTLGEYYEPFMLIRSMHRQTAVQARVPIILNIRKTKQAPQAQLPTRLLHITTNNIMNSVKEWKATL